jgi:predicted RNA-binding Zn ribbon-like protein
LISEKKISDRDEQISSLQQQRHEYQTQADSLSTQLKSSQASLQQSEQQRTRLAAEKVSPASISLRKFLIVLLQKRWAESMKKSEEDNNQLQQQLTALTKQLEEKVSDSETLR